jgi:hypothetical protein
MKIISKLSAKVNALQQTSPVSVTAANVVVSSNESSQHRQPNPVPQVVVTARQHQLLVRNTSVQRQRQIDAALEGSWAYEQNPPLRYRPQRDMDAEGWLSKGNCSRSSYFPGQSYVWKPLSQPLRNYTLSTFCRLMRGRHLIVVGDSINDQFFLTLCQMLWPWEGGLSIKQFYHKYGKGKDKTMFDNAKHMMLMLIGNDPKRVPAFYIPCPEGGPTNNHFRLSFIRNYYLGLSRKDASRPGEMLKPFIPFLETHRGAVMVLNRGAHFKPDDVLMRGLSATLSYLQEKHRDALIIYRDTPAGHVNYASYQQSVPLSVEAFQVRNQEQSSNPLYHQYRFGDFDR